MPIPHNILAVERPINTVVISYGKNVNKQPYTKWVDFDGKRIFDVVV